MLPFRPVTSLDSYHKGLSRVKPLITLLCLGCLFSALWTKATSTNSIVNGVQLEDCTCSTRDSCQLPD